jgi:hypothetical protein
MRPQRVPGLAWPLPVSQVVEFWWALQQLEQWQRERQQQDLTI